MAPTANCQSATSTGVPKSCCPEGGHLRALPGRAGGCSGSRGLGGGQAPRLPLSARRPARTQQRRW
eukprot:1713859-Alexandrium_andersonii.AAC.1